MNWHNSLGFICNFFKQSSISINLVFGSMSANTTFPPTISMIFAHATNVHAGIIISSSFLTFKANRIEIAALVHEFVRKAIFYQIFLKYSLLPHKLDLKLDIDHQVF